MASNEDFANDDFGIETKETLQNQQEMDSNEQNDVNLDEQNGNYFDENQGFEEEQENYENHNEENGDDDIENGASGLVGGDDNGSGGDGGGGGGGVDEEPPSSSHNNGDTHHNQNSQSDDGLVNTQQLAEEAEKAAAIEEENKNKFIESQSDLFKEIYSKSTNGSLNIHVCSKLEEIINLNKLSLEDLNNQILIELLQDLNENCLDCFDQFVSDSQNNINDATAIKNEIDLTGGNETSDAVLTEATALVDTNTTEPSSNPVDSSSEKPNEQKDQELEEVPKEQKEQEPATKTESPKTNVELLIDSINEWKNSNQQKLNSSKLNETKKIQSLFSSGHLVKNKRQQQPRPGPNEQKLKEILERTGYSHEVSSGQRKYGGPPPDWPVKAQIENADNHAEESTVKESSTPVAAESASTDTPTNDINESTENKPTESNTNESTSDNNSTSASASAAATRPLIFAPHGCECFVGKLPRDLFEDELIPVFEKQGRIWDLRLMIDPSTGYSKGYCFVTYCDKESAQTAAKNLNDYEIRPGKTIRVNVSVANIKLFIGNIPKTKSKEELKQEFTKIVEGISDVIIYNQLEGDSDKFKNRGFCFIEFVDHKFASMAKRKLSSPRFNRVFNREIAVDWADPSDEPDEQTMAKVKVLYVRNLSSEITEQEVEKLFEQYGKLERVRKMKDYAFVHFEQRDDAVKAMQEQQSKILGKNQMEISLARPLTDKKKQAQQKRHEKIGNNMNGNNWNNNNNNNNNNNTNNYNQRQQNHDQYGMQYSGQGGGNMNRFNNNNNRNNNAGGRYMNNNNNNNNQRNNQRNFNNNNNNNNRSNFGSQNFNSANRNNNSNSNRNNYMNNRNNNNNQMNRGGGGGGGGPNRSNQQQQQLQQQQIGKNFNNMNMNKRKGETNYSNQNQNKKARYIPNNNNLNSVSMDSINSNGNNHHHHNNNNQGNGGGGGGWQMQQQQQSFNNNNSNNPSHANNDHSNEWYQDNFNSNQWI